LRAKEIKGEKKKPWRQFLILLFLSVSTFGTILSSPAQAQDKLKRFHLRVEIGHLWSDGFGGNFKELLRNWEYGYSWTGGAGIGEGPGKENPAGEQGNNFFAFKVDYSLSARWALRLTVTPSVRWDIEGVRLIQLPFNFRRFLNIESRYKGGAYYAGFVYATDAQAMPDRVRRAFAVPVAGRIAYPLAVTKASAQPVEAKRFTTFVRSAQGQAILAKHGFGKP